MSDATVVMVGSAAGAPEGGGLPRLVPAAEPSGPSLASRWYLHSRGVLEWLVALSLTILTIPLLAVLAALLKGTSKGPVAYSQVRLGKDGRRFRIYKLRSMAHDCEAATGPVWSIAGDPRVTKVGRWLRDTHLDELPQLWNVLRGEMSLIGPRPERPEIAEQIEKWLPEFRKRLAVRPGIAGLAQICLPPDADLYTVRRKLAYDLRYIENIGPSLDARIAVATAFHFVARSMASISRMLTQPRTPPAPIEANAAAPNLGLSLADRAAESRVELPKVA